MSEIKRVKIQNIVESQIPEFLNEESPLFREFLEQYYLSQEYQTGIVDLAENIKKYKSIETFNNETFYSNEVPCTLEEEISSFGDVILVNHTNGFPEKNGLIKIDNEIIYYKEKTNNSFVDCLRGFSGLSKGNSNEFEFSTTDSGIHLKDSTVINLSLQFFEELFKKFKYQYLPGFEERSFVSQSNLKLILAKARDFYVSKGTDVSFSILFNILFNKRAEVVNPLEYTIKPSSNEYILTRNILVESISGENLQNLKGKSVLQISEDGRENRASIYNVEFREVGQREFFEFSLDPESFEGNIQTTKKTFITEDTIIGNTSISVDSTVGFPISGFVIVKSKNLSDPVTLNYKNKTLTQFLEIDPIQYDFSFGDEIIENNLTYSFTDDGRKVSYRICNTISEVDVSNTFGLVPNDIIKLSSISKNYDSKVELLNWNYNVPNKNLPSKKATSLNISGISRIPTEVQNTYLDSEEKNVYVISSGFPGYIFSVDERKLSFSPTISGVGSTTILSSSSNHNLITGEKIYFYGNLIGIQTGSYFVTSISNNQISLSFSNFDVLSKKYIEFPEGSYSINAVKDGFQNSNSIKELKHQELLKKINVEKEKKDNLNISKSTNNKRIGILRNGVELCSPSFFNESIYYGKIESIDITSPGRNYDVINKPEIEILDQEGKNASAFLNLSGSLAEVKVISPGVGFEKKPKISLIGGNGSGAVLDSNFIKQRIESNFNGFSGISGNTIVFLNNHNFSEGEEIFYINNSNQDILPLKNNSNYFAKIIDSNKINLHNSRSDALIGINTVTITGISTGFHSFRTVSAKNVINKIYVKNPGINYSNIKCVVNSPLSGGVLDEFENSGISIHDNYIFSKNHLFVDGDKVIYQTKGTPISGLTTNTVYFVKKIDENKFSLALSENDVFDKKFVKILGIGTGIHEFLSPPIEILVESITGLGSTSISYPILEPIVLGEVRSASLLNPGVGYGSSAIINFNRQPTVEIKKPIRECILKPIITNGSIVDVQIINSGFGYGSDVDIIVFGNGRYAELIPIIQNTRITSIGVINGGKGYGQETSLVVKKRGDGAKFYPNITEWTINQVVKNKNIIASETNGEGFLVPSYNEEFGLEYVNFYPPKNLRDQLNDNGTSHSPILGWSYDGHPIYGPFSYENPDGSGAIKRLTPGYQERPLSSLNALLLRPPFENGYFIQDYEYVLSNEVDLDENNGRFCKTPEYPNGVYAYFSSFIDKNESNDIITDLSASYPYVISKNFKNTPSIENYNSEFNQLNFERLNLDITRNTYPYSPEYPLLSEFSDEYRQEYKVREILSSKVDEIRIYDPGTNYKVGDNIRFDNKNTNGSGVSATISRVKGKKINAFSVGINTFKDVEFINRQNTIIGIANTPHGLVSNENVIISASSLPEFSYIEGIKKIEVKQNYSTLIEDVPPQSITGVTTFIRVGDVFGFEVDDFIKINSEILTINSIDLKENKINVNRYQNFSGVHLAGITSVVLLPRKFTFVESSILSSAQIFENKKVYFDPSTSVGLGTTGKEYTKIVGIKTASAEFQAISPISIGINTSLIEIGDFISGQYLQNGTRVINIGIGTIGISLNHTFNDIGIKTSTVSVGRSIFDKFIPEKSLLIPGHNFYTGQPLTYKTGLSGIGLSVSNTINGSIFTLSNNQTVYAVNYGNNYVGLSTIGFTSSIGIGSTLNSLYFVSPTFGIGKAHSLETQYTLLLGKVENYSVNVSTAEEHELKFGDKIRFEYLPEFEEKITLRYDRNSKKITTELINFQSNQVNLLNGVIPLPNNNLKTGDKVIYYTNNQGVIGNLINNESYFVIKDNSDSIKLSNHYIDAISGIAITFSNVGVGTHSVALINPPLKVSKGNIVKVEVENTDRMKLKLYKDFNLLEEYNEIDYVLPNGDYVIDTKNKIFPKEIYYNLVPLNNSTLDEKLISSDNEVIGKNKIEILNNEFNNFDYNTIPSNNTEFKFNLARKPQILNINNLESISYDTSSSSAKGPISRIKINFEGKSYRKIPKITSIDTEEGSDAILTPLSKTIGKISDFEPTKISYDYPTDTTLTPFLSVPAVCEITDISRIDSISIIDPGKNYNKPPILRVLGNNQIRLSAKIQGESVVSVSIDRNVQNLSSPLDIISVRNSNGFDIDDIVVGAGNTSVTLELINNDNQQYPLITTGYGSTEIVFPFAIGDEIFIENCRIEESNKDNFNSFNYDYKFFKVIGISTENFTVTYDPEGISSNFGTYDNTFGYGYVSNKKDIAKFKMNLIDDLSYISGEKVTSSNFEAIVMDNGWDNEINQLRLIDCVGELLPGDNLLGSKSKLNGKVLNINQFNLTTSLDVFREKVTENSLNNSLSNDYLIRISDNFYYQRFSYAVNSEVPYSEWKEPVRSLIHPSGFREFSDLNIVSESSSSLKPKTSDLKIDLSINVDNIESFYTRNNLSLVTEDNIFEDGSIENIVIGAESANVAGVGFTAVRGVALRPYILNKTNKVISIDDISNQFTGITTVIGGEIIGLTSFPLRSNGTPLFYREFNGNDQDTISLESNIFSISNHNFQTGQKLTYDAPTGGRIGITTTDLVDSSTIIIDENGNVSVSSTESNIITKIGSGIGSAIYEDGINIGITTTIVGVASTAPLGVSVRIIGFPSPFIPSSSNGIGTGARFTVLFTYDDSTGQPLSTSIVLRDGGSGYSIGDTVSIAGTYLFGSTPENNLSFVVSNVSSTKVIGAANNIYESVPVTSITGIGSSAKLTIARGPDGSIINASVYDGGVGYALTDKLKVSGNLIGGATPQDDYFFSPTSLGTNKLPSTVYVNKFNDNQFSLSGLSTLSRTSELNLESYGSGVNSFNYSDPNSSAIILIDNIIQSPIYYRDVYLSLSEPIGISSEVIYISSGINSITTLDRLLIGDEYIKVLKIGAGSTNSIEVERGVFGSQPSSHDVNSEVKVVRGDFNIVKDIIYFSTAPYGPIGPDLFKINSTFQGRVFSRSFDELGQPNDKNLILDDISKDFTGIAATNFVLKSSNQNVVGLFTDTNGGGVEINNNPLILINNVPQISGSDFIIDTPSQNTIRFISGVPNAGKLLRVSISTSFGYQPLVGASATVTVSSAGTISSVKINGKGSGYRTSPIISIASSIGSGAQVSAIVGVGGTIQSITVINPGSGYTSTSLPTVIIPPPPDYSDLDIVYYDGYSGVGTGAKASVKVSNGSSITQFDIEDPGVGYKVGDTLKISGITTNPLVGSNLKELKLIVDEVFTDKFSGFYPGQFIQFDDISRFFDGRKRKFTLFYTFNGVSDVITLRVQDGSDLSLDKNIFVFINDILQEPVKSYTFTGNRIIFKEAPLKDSKCNILFYRGSSIDVDQVDPPKTLKPGDNVQIIENINDPDDFTQFDRVVKRINSSDDFDTFTYDSIGINTNLSKPRPLRWEKQTTDKIINGVLYSKSRPSLNSNIFPTTNLIKSVDEFDTEIYVSNSFPLFNKIDNLGEDIRNVTIIESRDILPAIATAFVSYASSVSFISIDETGVGYGVTENPKISISSVAIQIRDPIKNWNTSVGLSTTSSINSLIKTAVVVSVGSNDFVGVSTNGINWFEYTINSFSNINYNDIAFSNTNRYIVVGDQGKISSSVGIGTTFSNWEEVYKLKLSEIIGVGEEVFEPSDYSFDLKSITFSEEKQTWSAVGSSGTVFYGVGAATTSLYEKRITSNILNSVTNNDSIFVTVGTNGYIGISTNSILWEQRSSGITFETLNDILWNGDQFITVGNNSTILTSNEGEIWNEIVDVDPGLDFKKIYYYDEMGVYVSLIGDENLYYSFDLVKWEKRTTNQNNTINDLLFVRDFGNYGRTTLVGSSGTSFYAEPIFNRATAVGNVSSGSLTSINITNGGFGYSEKNPPAILIESDTIKKEDLISIKSEGDFGKIIGINTFPQGTPGIGTTSPKVEFVLKSEFYDNTNLGIGYSSLNVLTNEDDQLVTYSQINVGDYFVILNSNSTVSHALTGITTSLGGMSNYPNSVVGTATTYLDGVYRAELVKTDTNLGIVTVTCHFEPVFITPGAGVVDIKVSLNGSGYFGDYTWGRIYGYQNRQRLSPKKFNVNTRNGLLGLSTSPQVYRTRPLK